MRTIMNLSMPTETADVIKKRAQKRGFASTSSYIRYLVESDEELISEKELLQISKQADKDYKAGKLKKLTSLKDLVK